MYYLLNFIPSILYAATLIEDMGENFFLFLAVFVLFLQPVYLLFVNIFFLSRRALSYFKSIICMALATLFNPLYTMVVYEVNMGSSVGSSFETACVLMVVVPTAIIIIGLLLSNFIKQRD